MSLSRMKSKLRATLRVGGLGLVLLTLAGCERPPMRPDPVEEVELNRRARDLLLRAAQSEIDIVCCNALEALTIVAPRDGRPYFLAATRSPNALIRFAGAVSIGRVRDCDATRQVRPLLDDPEPRVRLAAAFALYRCGDHGVADLLVRTLEKSPDQNLRADAAYLLGQLGEPRAMVRLRRAAQRDKSSKVVVQAYAALATLGDDKAADRLIQYTAGDQIARLIALQCLADLEVEAAREALLYRLRDPGDYLESRLLAARALGRLGSNAGFDLALQSCSATGQDETETMQIRTLAAFALGAIGDPRALPALRELASDRSDPRIQVAASLAICQVTERSGPGGATDRIP